MSNERVLLLGVYGMEAVEAGGALALAVDAGGAAHVAIMLAREASRPQVTEAAKILGATIEFLDFEAGAVEANRESKKVIVDVVRRFRPDIVITQDPEHSMEDLDPDRRQAMTVILEGIALAGRDFAVDELGGEPPHPIPTVYFMTPSRPNCTVDIGPAWDRKEAAMDVLESQMAFSGGHFAAMLDPDEAERLVPGFADLATDQERGRAVHREIDRAVHLGHGIPAHGSVVFGEAYRRMGRFEFDRLLP